MKLQFDLRPPVMLERERKKRGFNLTRLIAILLMGMFLVSSIGYIALMTWNRFAMQERVTEKSNELANLETDKRNLETQVNELRAREKVFGDTLKIMQEDLPSLEVMDALQAHMGEFGIGLKTLRFTIGRTTGDTKEPDVVEVTGTVMSDRQINDYVGALSGSGVFVDVLPPGTTLDANTGTIAFTLRMPVRTMAEIQKARQEG